MRDYYSLGSFFANIDERGLISYFTDAVPTPAMPLPSEQQEQSLERAELAIEAAEAKYARVREDARGDFDVWLNDREPSGEISGMVAHLTFDSFESARPHEVTDEYDKNKKKSADLSKLYGVSNLAEPDNQARTPKANSLAPGRFGKAIKLTGDDAVEIPDTGQYTRDQPFTFALWINTPETKERAVIFSPFSRMGRCGKYWVRTNKNRWQAQCQVVSLLAWQCHLRRD